MKYDAMIIIDMQTALVEAHPYNEADVVSHIKRIMEVCRNKGVPVIFVCHDGGKGDELEKDSEGWQIYKELSPTSNEKVFDKHYNSAFRQTGLDEYLKRIGAKNIIMCGMQTEYCFDVSCKVAFELEYNVTIPQGTTTTFDNDFASGEALSTYYEEKIWNHRYAEVLSVESVIAALNE